MKRVQKDKIILIKVRERDVRGVLTFCLKNIVIQLLLLLVFFRIFQSALTYTRI